MNYRSKVCPPKLNFGRLAREAEFFPPTLEGYFLTLSAIFFRRLFSDERQQSRRGQHVVEGQYLTQRNVAAPLYVVQNANLSRRRPTCSLNHNGFNGVCLSVNLCIL